MNKDESMKAEMNPCSTEYNYEDYFEVGSNLKIRWTSEELGDSGFPYQAGIRLRYSLPKLKMKLLLFM